MKRLIFLFCVALMLNGCTAYKLVRTGVTDSYNGVGTLTKDLLSGVGKVLQGGSVTLGVSSDAKHNNDVVEDIKE